MAWEEYNCRHSSSGSPLIVQFNLYASGAGVQNRLGEKSHRSFSHNDHHTCQEDSQMNKSSFILKSIVVVAGMLLCSALAHGQQRTFVASTGNDANNCLRPTPCRTLQRGHNTVAANGEVVALDSAGYGTLSITKSVTITGVGVHAAVTASGGADGVTITAAGATVILRELTITGTGTGSDGVRVSNAATVYIERCVITSFANHGIDYQTNNRLFVTDTVVRSNGGTGLQVIAPVGGTARITVDGSRFEGNGVYGIGLIDAFIEASITNSIMSENGDSGLEVSSYIVSGDKRVNVAHSTAANNGGDGFFVGGFTLLELNIEYSVARGNAGSGMFVGADDTIRVSNSVSTNNDTGFNNAGGTFESRGNNTVAGNTNPNVGAITPLTPQ